jgi:hypothetical protein
MRHLPSGQRQHEGAGPLMPRRDCELRSQDRNFRSRPAAAVRDRPLRCANQLFCFATTSRAPLSCFQFGAQLVRAIQGSAPFPFAERSGVLGPADDPGCAPPFATQSVRVVSPVENVYRCSNRVPRRMLIRLAATVAHAGINLAIAFNDKPAARPTFDAPTLHTQPAGRRGPRP